MSKWKGRQSVCASLGLSRLDGSRPDKASFLFPLESKVQQNQSNFGREEGLERMMLEERRGRAPNSVSLD